MAHRKGIAGYFYALLVAGAIFSLAAPPCARAVPPKYFEIANALAEIRDGQITAKLAVGFDNVLGLYEMLKDGASVELVVNARLERVRTLWTNVVLTEMEVSSALQHNPLTREFSLYMPGEAKPLMDKNLDRLLAATWSKLSVRIGPTSTLDGEKNTAYRVVLTLSLQHAKVPPWLSKNFVFWSKNVVEPEKLTLPFTY